MHSNMFLIYNEYHATAKLSLYCHIIIIIQMSLHGIEHSKKEKDGIGNLTLQREKENLKVCKYIFPTLRLSHRQ